MMKMLTERAKKLPFTKNDILEFEKDTNIQRQVEESTIRIAHFRQRFGKIFIERMSPDEFHAPRGPNYNKTFSYWVERRLPGYLGLYADWWKYSGEARNC